MLPRHRKHISNNSSILEPQQKQIEKGGQEYERTNLTSEAKYR